MYSTRKGNAFALFFVIYFLFGNLTLGFVIEATGLITSTTAAIGLNQVLFVGLPLVFYFLLVKTPMKETLRLYKTHPVNYVLSLLLAVFTIPLVMLINLISQFFVRSAVEGALTDVTKGPFIITLIVMSVFPAIFEELISRGIILSHYRHKKVITAALMSGFFFGMMHMNLNQFLYAFVLGSLFALVVHLTGSIFPSMLMHFVVNAVNVSIAFLSTNDVYQNMPGVKDQIAAAEAMSTQQQLLMALPVVGILVLMSLPIVFGILFAIASFNDKWKMLVTNQASVEFFYAEKTPTGPVEIDMTKSILEQTDLLVTDIHMDQVEKSARQNQPIITFPLIFVIIIFIAMSVISEVM